MATKRTKRTTKRVKNLPSRSLSGKQAKQVKGGAIEAITIKQK